MTGSPWVTYSVLQASLVPTGLAHCIADQCLLDDGKGERERMETRCSFHGNVQKKRESDWGRGELKKKKRRSLTEI